MEQNRGATQRYSAGNKVYGSGRSNPTSGTVNPTGYVDRGFNNAASDRRSGLAQAAFSRLQGMNGPVGGGVPTGGALPTVQNTDQRQALIQQNFQTTPQGHYIPNQATLNSAAPLAQNRPDLLPAIQRRLQGGLNG